MLHSTLRASLLGNIKGMNRAGEGNEKGQGIVRADYRNKNKADF